MTILRRLGILITLLILAATPAWPLDAADTPLELNVILSLTGQGSFIGRINQEMLSGLEATVNKRGGIKGQPIHFVFGDDQTSPQVSVQLVNALIAKGVPVFLGPSITGTCRAVTPLVLSGPVDFCLSPGLHPAKGSYGYSVSVATSDMIGVALRYFRERGWRRIARLTTTDATGQDADESFTKWLALPENKDLIVVDDEKFNVTDISVAAQVARIKASQPQVVIFWCTGTPMATALRAYEDAGLELPVFVSNSNMTTTQMQQYASITPKQYFSAAPGYVAGISQSTGSKKAQDDYLASIAAVGLRNDYVSGIAWDAAEIVLDAYRQLGPTVSAQQIRDYINRLNHYTGIGGTYDFTDGSQRGLSQKDIMVMQFHPTGQNWKSVSGFGGTPARQ